jgi:tetratricopeptide (TPR) repeat protein
MFRALSLLILALLAVPASAQEYQSKELAEAAAAYRQELLDSVPANKRQPGLIPRLRKDADEEYRAKRYAQAIEDLSRAISFGADDGLIWLRLAQNQAAADDDHVQGSAYNAYLRSTEPVERGGALFLIGRDYDRHDKQKEALAAFQSGLAFTKSITVAERCRSRLNPMRHGSAFVSMRRSRRRAIFLTAPSCAASRILTVS